MITFFYVQQAALLFGITYEDGGVFTTSNGEVIKLDRFISLYLGIFGINIKLKKFK